MAFASACPPSAAGRCSPTAVAKGGSGFRPEVSRPGRLPTLKKRAEFVQIAKEGRKAALPGVVLQGRPRTSAAVTGVRVRIGITATRKLGNAVVRNRIRRRLRAAAEIVARFGTPGWDFVLIGRPATLVRPFSALKGDVMAALKRMSAYTETAEGNRPSAMPSGAARPEEGRA